MEIERCFGACFLPCAIWMLEWLFCVCALSALVLVYASIKHSHHKPAYPIIKMTESNTWWAVGCRRCNGTVKRFNDPSDLLSPFITPWITPTALNSHVASPTSDPIVTPPGYKCLPRGFINCMYPKSTENWLLFFDGKETNNWRRKIIRRGRRTIWFFV